MIELNTVVLSVLACIENESVRKEIEKNYVLKVQKLKYYDSYISSEEFKSKKINDINFQNCVKYATSRLDDDKFRLFTEKAAICFIAFYKKNTHQINTINSSTPNSLDALKGIISKYYIEDSTLFVCVNPIKVFKDRVLEKKDDIIKFFNEHNKPIDNVVVKYIHKGNILDEMEEVFLSLGYTLQQKK